MNETDLARFDVARWDPVTSIGLVRLNPLGDCVISLSARDGRGVVLRLFDPERSLDALSLPEGHCDPHADLIRSLLWYVNHTFVEDGDVRKFEALAVFFHRSDDRWRATIKFGIEDESEVFWAETSPQVALSTFSVENIPSFIEKDEMSTCDITGHRDALLFGLRGGDDALEGLRSSVMRGLGITIRDTKDDGDET